MSEQMFYTYILRSKVDKSYYIGQTNDVESRVLLHNKGLVKSTRYRVPFDFVYAFSFEERADAIKFERYLKSKKKRAYIEKLIASHKAGL